MTMFPTLIEAIEQEDKIVWLRDPAPYDYLREVTVSCPFRSKMGKSNMISGVNSDGGPGAHTVAYATLKSNATGFMGRFERRLWWVKEYDRYAGSAQNSSKYKGTYTDPISAPCEAVNIRTIKAGVPSERWHPDKA